MFGSFWISRFSTDFSSPPLPHPRGKASKYRAQMEMERPRETTQPFPSPRPLKADTKIQNISNPLISMTNSNVIQKNDSV